MDSEYLEFELVEEEMQSAVESELDLIAEKERGN